MIDNILYSLNAVLPLVVLIGLGFLLKHKKLLSDKFFSEADKLVFNIALPAFIFVDISGSVAGDIFDIKLAVFCVSGIILSFVILMVLVPLLIRDKFSRGAFIQGIYRSNFAILGVPLAGALFGNTGLSAAALILPFAIPLFNIFAVIALTVNAPAAFDKEKSNGDKTSTNLNANINIKKIVLNIIKNPLIISVAAAIPFMFFKVIPPMILKSLNYLGNMSTPLALLSLGAGISTGNRQTTKESVKLSVYASVIRVVVMPLIFVTAGILCGFRNAALIVIFVLFGAPTAVSSYIMAKNMSNNHELAGQIVVITTVICPLTIFIGSFILRTAGLI